jgi:foldase protein PrsA
MIVNGRDTIDFHRVPDVFNQFMHYSGLTELSLEDKYKALKGWAQKDLIIQAGHVLGYDDDPGIKAEREKLYHTNTKKMIYRGSRDIDYQPPESLIQEYYDQHKAMYTVEKPIRVQHIIVQDSVLGEYIRDQALSGIDFLELAREYYPGEPEIREAAADLGYIGSGEMPEEFFTAALGLKVGDVSHPVKTEFGYHVIKLFDKQYSKVLEEMRIEIVHELEKRHNRGIYDAWLADLSDGHTIEYLIDDLDKIELPPRDER